MKRKYHHIVTLVLIAISFQLFAVNSNDIAINTANSFIKSNAKGSQEFKIVETFVVGNKNKNSVVVFNMSPIGFIVVSDNGVSILAFSFSNNIPDNQSEDWILFENMILGINSNQSTKIQTENIVLKHNKSFEIGPFVQSLWGQVNCKDKNGNTVNVTNYYTPNNYAVGCVAISMSTLMQHYNWPVNGVSSNTFSDNYGSSKGTYSADFENTEYPWDDMLNRYNNKVSTLPEREAAGLLAFHSAVALEMDFEYNGSTSNVNRIPNAGRDYFRYSSQNRYPSSSVFWPLLDSNMMHEIPVVLAIAGNGYGHSVICDGIRIEEDSTFYYHLNMGWWGSANGWYKLKEDWNAGGYSQVTGGVFNFLPIPSLEIPYFEENNDSVTIKWVYPETPNFSVFELQKSINGGHWETISDSLTQNEKVVFVSPDEDNKFRVKAKNNDLWATDSWSNTEMAIWDNTSINEYSNEIHFTIMPNPLDNILTIYPTKDNTKAQIQIFDLYGRRIFDIFDFHNINKLSLDVSHLKSGIYILKYKTANSIGSVKFIKK